MKIKNILLIDDNEIDNFVNQYLVIKCNVAENVVVKKSAREALDYLKTLKDEFPNLILLDIRMPGMDGFEFLENFEKFPEHLKAQCNVCMLSASVDPYDLQRIAKNPTVKTYLHKPLSPGMLSDMRGF